MTTIESPVFDLKESITHGYLFLVSSSAFTRNQKKKNQPAGRGIFVEAPTLRIAVASRGGNPVKGLELHSGLFRSSKMHLRFLAYICPLEMRRLMVAE